MDLRNDVPHDLPAPHFTASPALEDIVAVLAVAEDEDVSFDQIVTLLDTRPAIAAAMIRTANSASLGAVQQVRSLRHALALIGLKQIRRSLLEMKTTSLAERNRIAS